MANVNLNEELMKSRAYKEAEAEQVRAMNGAEPLEGFRLTETGNAERLAHQHGQVLRWCEPWKKWLVYTGTHWQIDASHRAQQLGKETVRAMYAEAAASNDDEYRRKLAKFAWQSETAKLRHTMLELAKGEGKIPVLPAQFDRDPWLLNVANGTLDLRTGTLRSHDPVDYITKYIPIAYDPDATCPQWEAFLESIMDGKQEVIEFLQYGIGYSLTGDIREDALFLLHGNGANGKSTFLTVLRELLADYGKQAAFSTFLHQERETVRNDLADLQGSRLVVASETDEGKRLSMSVVKSLTGKDVIKARFLFAEYFEYAPQMKLWLAANHKPVITGTDHAIWRRIRLIPFTKKFEGESDDKKLGEKLRAELPGILTWAMNGCLEWQKHGLPLPETVMNATGDYRKEMDVLGNFLEECCRVQDGLQTSAGTLLEALKSHTGDKNFTQQKMKAALEEKGFIRQRSSLTGHMMWQRIGLVGGRDNDDS